jgi:hypothetical protein
MLLEPHPAEWYHAGDQPHPVGSSGGSSRGAVQDRNGIAPYA